MNSAESTRFSPKEPEFYKALVLEFCDHVVNYQTGRLREDPVIRAVTENHGGSSCGFLLHFIAEMIGIREHWVNRDSVSSYRQGMNLSLMFGATWDSDGPKCARRVFRNHIFNATDFLIMEDPTLKNDDHVCICAKDFDGKTLLSYDLGQKGASIAEGGAQSVQNDARFCERAVKLEANGHWETKPDSEQGKQVWGVVSVVDMVNEACVNGKLVAPTDFRTWRDTIAAGG